MAVFIGSMSINSIVERRTFGEFKRRHEARLDELREVLARVGRGEVLDRDVLGAREDVAEREWAEGEFGRV